MSRYLPVFPLGTAIVPTQILPLHVFEDRYRVLMEVLTESGAPGDLGVVLIERGSEIGGGEQRMSTGTVVRLVEAKALPDGRWLAVFAGSHRFRVRSWLPDDPFPQADVDEEPDEPWDPADQGAFDDAEAAVRQALTLAAELGDGRVRHGFALSPDRALAAWELCTLAPIGPLDRQRLLEAPSRSERLVLLREQVDDMARVLAFRLQGR